MGACEGFRKNIARGTVYIRYVQGRSNCALLFEDHCSFSLFHRQSYCSRLFLDHKVADHLADSRVAGVAGKVVEVVARNAAFILPMFENDNICINTINRTMLR